MGNVSPWVVRWILHGSIGPWVVCGVLLPMELLAPLVRLLQQLAGWGTVFAHQEVHPLVVQGPLVPVRPQTALEGVEEPVLQTPWRGWRKRSSSTHSCAISARRAAMSWINMSNPWLARVAL